MKLATLACLAAASLIGTALLATGPAGTAARAAPAETAQKPLPAAPPAQPVAEPQATAAANPNAAGPRTGQSAGRGERRRRSYAACNRASHLRSLSGGKRRRFLIRCRLGYERTKGLQTQAPGAPQPPANPPGRRP